MAVLSHKVRLNCNLHEESLEAYKSNVLKSTANQPRAELPPTTQERKGRISVWL